LEEQANVPSARGFAASKTAGDRPCLLPVNHQVEPNLRDSLASARRCAEKQPLLKHALQTLYFTRQADRASSSFSSSYTSLPKRALLFPVCYCLFDKIEK